MIRVFIPGHPKPQGSKTIAKTRDGHTYLREANSKTIPWREVVTKHLRPLAGDKLTGPVRVSLHFFMPKPAKPNHPEPISARTYDIDKLSRSCLDAITKAGIWIDDRQCISLHAKKSYVVEDPGVTITIEDYHTHIDKFWD